MSAYPKNAKEFVQLVADLEFENAFNPYSDTCEGFDHPDAADLRRGNLELVVDAALSRGVETIWIARDLGYRGGRRTGLALTDEAHLVHHSRLLGTPPLSKATLGPTMAERTATVIWQMLEVVQQPVFLWNVFPLHPHEPGQPQSNRRHSRAERLACQHIMVGLMALVRPRVVLAIGRDAQLALMDLGVEAEGVRHPSYGGQGEFIRGVLGHYGIAEATDMTLPLFV